MKNIFRMFSGVTIVILAFTFSAFTNTKIRANSARDENYYVLFNYLVQRTPNQFNQISPTNPVASPEYTSCAGTADYSCVYYVTTPGHINIPSLATLGQLYYTPTQIESYLLSGYLTMPDDASYALYYDEI